MLQCPLCDQQRRKRSDLYFYIRWGHKEHCEEESRTSEMLDSPSDVAYQLAGIADWEPNDE